MHAMNPCKKFIHVLSFTVQFRSINATTQFVIFHLSFICIRSGYLIGNRIVCSVEYANIRLVHEMHVPKMLPVPVMGLYFIIYHNDVLCSFP